MFVEKERYTPLLNCQCGFCANLRRTVLPDSGDEKDEQRPWKLQRMRWSLLSLERRLKLESVLETLERTHSFDPSQTRMIAHGLNNLLTVMLGTIDLLSFEIGDTSNDQVREHIQTLARTLDRTKVLVNELFNSSSLTSATRWSTIPDNTAGADHDGNKTGGISRDTDSREDRVPRDSHGHSDRASGPIHCPNCGERYRHSCPRP